jgi:hypothetical protein
MLRRSEVFVTRELTRVPGSAAGTARVQASGRPLGRFLGLGDSSGSIPGNQPIQVVAVGTIGTKGFLVEKALNSAAQAYLIRMLLVADRPTHLAMPAAAQNEHCSPRNSGSNNTERQFPA